MESEIESRAGILFFFSLEVERVGRIQNFGVFHCFFSNFESGLELEINIEVIFTDNSTHPHPEKKKSQQIMSRWKLGKSSNL